MNKDRILGCKTLIELQDRILGCKDIFELCDMLNEIAQEVLGTESRLEDVVDITSLPTFGGTEPNDTEGAWSWDEESILCADAGWTVEPRLDIDD